MITQSAERLRLTTKKTNNLLFISYLKIRNSRYLTENLTWMKSIEFTIEIVIIIV